MKKSWLFLAAAAIPCIAALLFCGVGIHEWWLIGTKQIAVIPRPHPGDTSMPEVPASSLIPFILGSGALAATFGYALLRGSRKVLIAGYAAVGLIAALAYAARAGASQEGAGVAEAVLWIVGIAVTGFAAFVLGSAGYGGYKAIQAGESIARGIGRGILKGIGAFIIATAVVLTGLTVLGALYVAFALVYTWLNP